MPAFQRQPIAAAFALMLLTRAIPAAGDEDAVTRGEYLVKGGKWIGRQFRAQS